MAVEELLLPPTPTNAFLLRPEFPLTKEIPFKRRESNMRLAVAFAFSIQGKLVDGGRATGDLGGDPVMERWKEEIDTIVRGEPRGSKVASESDETNQAEEEPYSAWYQPVHFYGHRWGVYIREEALLSLSKDIARCVDPDYLRSKHPRLIQRQLLLSAYLGFYFHEHFHHKVESFGLRLLVSTGRDLYRPYERTVYRPSWGTVECLEESLANGFKLRAVFPLPIQNLADSLAEELGRGGSFQLNPRFAGDIRRERNASRLLRTMERLAAVPEGYRAHVHSPTIAQRSGLRKAIDPDILNGLYSYWYTIMPKLKPGYAQGVDSLEDLDFAGGLCRLQALMSQTTLNPRHADDWEVAPAMMTAMMDTIANTYLVRRAGLPSVFDSV
jgi:hypothetical protein